MQHKAVMSIIKLNLTTISVEMEGVHLFGSFEVVVRLRLNLLLYSHIYCFQPASKDQATKNSTCEKWVSSMGSDLLNKNKKNNTKEKPNLGSKYLDLQREKTLGEKNCLWLRTCLALDA